MAHTKTICDAIASRSILQITYQGGMRIVEPHMSAQNDAGHHALSAWFLRGSSKSGGQSWREYLLMDISEIVVLNETFAGPRPGYKSSGGQVFNRVVCCL